MAILETEAHERVYQSFLRGYRDSATHSGTAADASVSFPYASLIQAASLESKELRRSIDACRNALAQMASLPEAEQAQLKVEARSSLEALQSAVDQLLSRIGGLRPADPAPAPAERGKIAPARGASERPRKNRPRR